MASSNESNNAILLLAQYETGFKLAPSSYIGVSAFAVVPSGFVPPFWNKEDSRRNGFRDLSGLQAMPLIKI